MRVLVFFNLLEVDFVLALASCLLETEVLLIIRIIDGREPDVSIVGLLEPEVVFQHLVNVVLIFPPDLQKVLVIGREIMLDQDLAGVRRSLIVIKVGHSLLVDGLIPISIVDFIIIVIVAVVSSIVVSVIIIIFRAVILVIILGFIIALILVVSVVLVLVVDSVLLQILLNLHSPKVLFQVVWMNHVVVLVLV